MSARHQNADVLFWRAANIFAGQRNSICNGTKLSLTKLMVSHDLLRSKVANQIAFDQSDSKSVSIFERVRDRCCQAPDPKLETLEPITFT